MAGECRLPGLGLNPVARNVDAVVRIVGVSPRKRHARVAFRRVSLPARKQDDALRRTLGVREPPGGSAGKLDLFIAAGGCVFGRLRRGAALASRTQQIDDHVAGRGDGLRTACAGEQLRHQLFRANPRLAAFLRDAIAHEPRVAGARVVLETIRGHLDGRRVRRGLRAPQGGLRLVRNHEMPFGLSP
jgi:hypothetical protein